MKLRQPALLAHPLFLSGVFLLLLNDISWKYEFHNWFTGKLSDVAGLFAISVFFIAFFPHRKKWIIPIIAIAFSWWKSPYAQPVIDAINNVLPVTVARVVDPTDLWALAILPMAGLWTSRINHESTVRPLFIKTICGIALFSFCFTSTMRHGQYYYSTNRVNFYESFKTKKTSEDILDFFAKNGASWHVDSVNYYPIRNDELYYRKVDSNQALRWVPTSNTNDSVRYIREVSRPFYVLDQLIAGEDTLREVQVSIYEPGNKRRVVIQSFIHPWSKTSTYLEEADRKRIRKWFKQSLK